MHKVTSVSEKTFRQVYWRDLALKMTKNLHCVHTRRKVSFWCSTGETSAKFLSHMNTTFPLREKTFFHDSNFSIGTLQNLRHNGKTFLHLKRKKKSLNLRNVFPLTETTSAHTKESESKNWLKQTLA